MLSLADTAFALDPGSARPWSLRASLGFGLNPAPPAPLTLRWLLKRFSQAGGNLRQLASAGPKVWAHLDRPTIVAQTSDRLRDAFIIQQTATGLCGPIAIVAALARRNPARYVAAVAELLTTGRLTCPTGRKIEAEAELRAEPLVTQIAQVDWLLAATMRDDENIWEDVDDDANGLESMTFWGEQRGWIKDVLALSGGGWETCFVSDMTGCMRKAQDAVNAGGAAFLLIDRFLIKDGGSDDEEQASWAKAPHSARNPAHPFGPVHHSKDDDYPPDHWVEYLGGFALGDDPDDDDPFAIRLWCWGGEYRVTGTVGSLSEYLYAVAYGV